MQINWAHVHLIINHIPVIGLPGGILLLVYGIVRKNEEIKMLGLGLFVLLALLTAPVFLSGQAAEDVAEKLPGVTEAHIGRHEEIAGLALVFTSLLGATALAALARLKFKGAVPKLMITTILLLACLTAGIVGFTANLGGEIRHTEIRDTAASGSHP